MIRAIKLTLFVFLTATTFIVGFSGCQVKTKTNNDIKDEIIYHVFQRSFFDSNGDEHGDLTGIQQKLDYLQDLGVTSILLTPLYESVYYHNYYSSDFEKIDSTYGSKGEYLALIREMHRRGMKLYMDMETQYVTEDHPWYKESLGKPESKFSDYILYDDKEQLKPSSIVFDIYDLLGYDGQRRKITTVNLLNKEVIKYNKELFAYWLDPNQDGNFDDGVDGFRLDHMMDDLDNKGRLTNLFRDFWVPLIDTLKSINPKIHIMAEQADWGSYGIDYLTDAKVDWVFAFRIQQAIRTMDKAKIMAYADTTFKETPKGKNQILFIENHDIPRFSTPVKQDKGKERVGAALNLLIGGIPSIYYGQEIGMLGDSFFGKYGGITDSNEIPYREAFEWTKNKDTPGMAYWYRNSGPWWETSTVKSDDGISVEEQQNDPNSLLSTYKSLIKLRKEHPVLINGSYQSLNNSSKDVVSFYRINDNTKALVVINLSANEENIELPLEKGNPNLVYGENKGSFKDGKLEVVISGSATQVWLMK
jgi:glycosidase